MGSILMVLGLVFGIGWLWQFIKIVDRPTKPTSDADFWQACYFTEYWDGTNEKP
jgi:hypothetical protein